MRLWRPTGPIELTLIADSGWRAFPPRIPDQPIFYPVLNFGYAEQIAKDWNSVRESENFEGYVVEFDVHDDVASHYPAQIVGGKEHRELWVPAEELSALNGQILGCIRLVASYRNGVRES